MLNFVLDLFGDMFFANSKIFIMNFSGMSFIYQVIPQDAVGALYSACKSGDFDLADKEVNHIIAEGYPVSQLLLQVPFTVVMHA